MNYIETINYIHSTPKFSRILGNDLLRKLLERLGNPQNKLQFVHIAGTNGKGSAAIILSEILVRSGYTVGLFTSPYIEVFNERIKVNGNMISDTDLADIATDIRKIIEEYNTPVSEFALDTAIAFEYFKNCKCDIVVLETGLGGRLDATNVIEKSLVSVIMSIGLDHTQYLGETIEEITAEKCGIIKKDGYTVTYPKQSKSALDIIKNICLLQNNTFIQAEMPEIKEDNLFEYKDKEYALGLCGDFQKYNAATVIETIEILRKQGFIISDAALSDGLKNAFNPVRFEKLPCGIIIDGAHNRPAAKALCATLKKIGKPVNLCIAMMDDKDISGFAEEIAKINPKVIVTEIDMPRCTSLDTLRAEFAKHKIEVLSETDPIKAVRLLQKITEQDEIACVCGSLYFAGEIRKKFNV